MSYGMAAGLQAAIYQRLVQDAALSALVGGAIHDAVPPGRVPPLYVTLGPEEVRERGDGSAGGALHRFAVTVVSESAGFQQAKAVAGAVSDALVGAELMLVRGQVTRLSFLRARARRETAGQARRIDLTFQARVDDGI
ncbi:DUF3168 domain-containing protein [Roseovarius sp.]|uniref:DUF3168 domain-containing protein n=1 Tax=Roseovarius sp. TaxID=1486281 RepID=UPI003A97245A